MANRAYATIRLTMLATVMEINLPLLSHRNFQYLISLPRFSSNHQIFLYVSPTILPLPPPPPPPPDSPIELNWFQSYAQLDKNFKEMDSFYQELIDEHLDIARKNEDDLQNLPYQDCGERGVEIAPANSSSINASSNA
ncbi:hypothetical protein LguiA_003664 [Lonicera macranthoides]